MATPETPAANDTQLLLQLVKLLMEDKQIEAEERKAKRVAQEARDKSSRQISDYNEKQQQNREKLCTHLKNQPSKLYKSAPSIRTDYAVSHHTFPDGNTYIRCLVCGAKWHKGDTAETWTKKGAKVPNWTGIGWVDAVKMVAQSTNTATASELVVSQQPAPQTN
jgi:hypothetical protein